MRLLGLLDKELSKEERLQNIVDEFLGPFFRNEMVTSIVQKYGLKINKNGIRSFLETQIPSLSLLDISVAIQIIGFALQEQIFSPVIEEGATPAKRMEEKDRQNMILILDMLEKILKMNHPNKKTKSPKQNLLPKMPQPVEEDPAPMVVLNFERRKRPKSKSTGRIGQLTRLTSHTIKFLMKEGFDVLAPNDNSNSDAMPTSSMKKVQIPNHLLKALPRDPQIDMSKIIDTKKSPLHRFLKLFARVIKELLELESKNNESIK